MEPEETRHAAVVAKENEQNRAIVDSIRAELKSLDVLKMSGNEPVQVGICIQAKFYAEDKRHRLNEEQEQRRNAAADAQARAQAGLARKE